VETSYKVLLKGLSPEIGSSQGQNLALTVLTVQDSLDSSLEMKDNHFAEM